MGTADEIDGVSKNKIQYTRHLAMALGLQYNHWIIASTFEASTFEASTFEASTFEYEVISSSLHLLVGMCKLHVSNKVTALPDDNQL